ncbi:MAG: hypothetical protein C0498_04435 [Anaerolinea sp.]|nr:hypothetical protein [Anaerolinea sp.]
MSRLLFCDRAAAGVRNGSHPRASARTPRSAGATPRLRRSALCAFGVPGAWWFGRASNSTGAADIRRSRVAGVGSPLGRRARPRAACGVCPGGGKGRGPLVAGQPDRRSPTVMPLPVDSAAMNAATPRRLVILTEGQWHVHNAKTAMGVIRYGPDHVVALLDSTIAGRSVAEWMPGHDIPIVASIGRALVLPERPDTLLIGIAPTGGKLPPAWRATILEAIRAGLNVHSGLHTFLGDDPELAAAAAAAGVELVDYRRAPERMETAVGRRHKPGSRVILTVGTDCAIGKMSVALELRRSALAAGDAAVFVPTGQTGMMIDGWGVAVDRVISDFVQGTVEWMLEEGETRGDWLIVEGQGSLDHPAYSSVTLGLIHGATPHAMVMVHKPGMAEHDFDHLPDASFPIARLPDFIRLHESVAGLVAPSKVVGIALNTSLYPDAAETRRIVEQIEAETGLPTADPVRFGADRLWREIRAAVEDLPWVRENDARAAG